MRRKSISSVETKQAQKSTSSVEIKQAQKIHVKSGNRAEIRIEKTGRSDEISRFFDALFLGVDTLYTLPQNKL